MPCEDGCNGCYTLSQNTEANISMKLDGSQFHKVLTVDDLFTLFQNNPNASYVLHGGNTAHGNDQ